MIMSVNDTCVLANDTLVCSHNPSSSSTPNTGLAVGLALFFLLIVVAVGVFVYRYFTRVRHRRVQQKEDCVETPQTEPQRYTTRQQSAGQTPIYENVTRTAVQSRNQSRLHSEPDEDLYLQCDLPGDAIYSNDPACNLAILPDEDVYILPDS